MNTINSLSGGKTSSYLAVNYPADYEIFSVVCVDDIKCGHPDKLVMQYVNDKLSNYSQTFGEFMGTAENPIILKTMMDLEQKLGKEIIWVRGLSMDKIIAKKKMLPNQNNRFCTSETKMRPIFEWCYMHTELPVKMRVGFRWDESHRKDRFSLNFEYSLIANKGKVWRHKWIETDWRVGEFPLIDNKVHVQTNQFGAYRIAVTGISDVYSAELLSLTGAQIQRSTQWIHEGENSYIDILSDENQSLKLLVVRDKSGVIIATKKLF